MTANADNYKLPAEKLTADLAEHIFGKLDKYAEQEQVFVGHHRAKEALSFGLSMKAPGFNVFAMGEHGTGRQTLIKQMLQNNSYAFVHPVAGEELASMRPTVNSFALCPGTTSCKQILFDWEASMSALLPRDIVFATLCTHWRASHRFMVVALMAIKNKKKICLHAGGVGLCNYAAHVRRLAANCSADDMPNFSCRAGLRPRLN